MSFLYIICSQIRSSRSLKRKRGDDSWTRGFMSQQLTGKSFLPKKKKKKKKKPITTFQSRSQTRSLINSNNQIIVSRLNQPKWKLVTSIVQWDSAALFWMSTSTNHPRFQKPKRNFVLKYQWIEIKIPWNGKTTIRSQKSTSKERQLKRRCSVSCFDGSNQSNWESLMQDF